MHSVIKDEYITQPRLWNVAIIGSGSKCFEFLNLLANDYRYLLKMNVVGVACISSDDICIDFAKRWGVESIVTDYHEFYKNDDIELIIELTGDNEIANEISRTKPFHMHFIDHVSAEFFVQFFKLAAEKTRIEKETARELLLSRFKLQETQEYLQNILKNSPNIIFTVDTSGRILSINDHVEVITGRKREDVMGKSLTIFARQPSQIEELIEQASEKGNAYDDEISLVHENGTTIYCRLSLTAITDTEQKTSVILGICRDITQRKRLQDDLVNSERLAAIGKMAAGIAHEINNPISVIDETAGWLSDLLEDIDSISIEDREEFSGSITHIRDQVKRCKNITHGLLGYSRKSLSKNTSIDLHKLIENTLILLNYEVKRASVEFEKKFAPNLPPILSNPQKLEQVFVNILTNAIHATKEKYEKQTGIITITTEKKEQNVIIRFQDRGIGISEDKIDKIFDVFYTSKPDGKGTGLGLAICREIIKKLNGTITVSSISGKGTTFTIELPLTS